MPPSILIDWCSAVFKQDVVGPIPGFVKEVRELFDETVDDFQDRTPINVYRYTAETRTGKVAVAWGGNADTVLLKIPGDACARVESWVELREFVAQKHGWYSRIDIAFDDYDGTHPLEEAVQRYTEGQFGCGGRPPRIGCAGNWLHPDGYGRTLYIGKRENGKMLRVYEKGLQLHHGSGSPYVRWEFQAGNKDRVLPLEMVTEPARYMRGAYPALEFIGDAEGARIRTRKAQERLSVAQLESSASQSYGGLLDFLMAQGAIAGDVVQKLRRDAVPRRLAAPTAEELVARCNQLANAAIEYA